MMNLANIKVVVLAGFSIILTFVIIRQIGLVKSEYLKLSYNKELEAKIVQAINENRQLQQELVKAQKPSYKELQVRKQLLLGFPEEEIFVLDKPLYQPPPLKQVRIID